MAVNIMTAIRAGDVRKVNRLITRGKLKSWIFPWRGNYLNKGKKRQYLSLLDAAVQFADNFEVIELIIQRGADINYQDSIGGYSVLHLCTRFDFQGKLLRYGASPLLNTRWGYNVLHSTIMKIRDFGYHPYAVQQIVEFEYNKALRDEAFDCSVVLRLLHDQTFVKLNPIQFAQWFAKSYTERKHKHSSKLCVAADYLRSWEDPIAIPTQQEFNDNSSDEGVKVNPVLSSFQYILVIALLNVIAELPIHQTRYRILGYLSPIDLLNGWGSLTKNKSMFNRSK